MTDRVAAREREPGSARGPAADASLRFELAPAGVTRAFVDLIDRLRPAAGAHPFGDVFPRPAVAIRIGEDLRGFIFPILPPMLDHEALVVVAGDDEHMLQYDLAPGVLDHADDLVTARPFGFEHFVIGVPARRFLHVEADAGIDRKSTRLNSS